MARRLIMCSDRTWNDPEDQTNIAWLKDNIVEDEEQLIYYDTGVGTNWTGIRCCSEQSRRTNNSKPAEKLCQ